MTFKEFLQKHPEDVEKAKSCKTIDEFKKMVDGFGISYEEDSELENAFDFVKNGQNAQQTLSEDELDDVAGGKAYRVKKGKYYVNSQGDIVFQSSDEEKM